MRRFTNKNYYYYYHDLNAPPTQQWQAVTIILFEHKLIFSSVCMCLMESRDYSEDMNTESVSEFMLCEIMFIQNSNPCLQ